MDYIPWTFKTWIKHFNGVDLPIGDLAEDICSDKHFPEDADDFDEIYDYLRDKTTSYEVLDTFLIVWHFYRSSTNDKYHLK